METQKIYPMTSRERVLAALRRDPVDRDSGVQSYFCCYSGIDGSRRCPVPRR